MKLIDMIVIGALALILGLVIRYIYKARKKGVKCIGCPDGGNCSGGCAGCSGGCNCADGQNKP